VVQIVLNFIRVDGSCFAFIKVRKSFLNGFPLHLELFEYFIHKVIIDHPFRDNFNRFRLALNLFSDIIFILRVLDRVMSKIEAFTRFDSCAHPFTKILEVKSPQTTTVSVL